MVCSLVLLAENGRLAKLDTVIEHFKTMMAAHRGEVPCQITSAKVIHKSTPTYQKMINLNAVLAFGCRHSEGS